MQLIVWQKVFEQVEVEYIPEKAELDGVLDEELRKVFEKFKFTDVAVSEVRELCKKLRTTLYSGLASVLFIYLLDV